MKFSYETQGANTYLVYQFGEGDQLDSTSYSMISNNRVANISEIVFTQMDADRYLKFNITAKVSGREFFTGAVTKARLLGVLSSLATALIAADEYMLNPSSLLLDLDYIFVDVRSNEATVICLPILRDSIPPTDFPEFLKDVIYRLQFDQNEDPDYITKLIRFLNDSAIFSLEKFKGVVDELRFGESQKTAGRHGGQPVIQPPPVAAAGKSPAQPIVTAQKAPQRAGQDYQRYPSIPVKQPQKEKKTSLVKRLFAKEEKHKAAAPEAPAKQRGIPKGKGAGREFAVPGQAPAPIAGGPAQPAGPVPAAQQKIGRQSYAPAPPPPPRPVSPQPIRPQLNFGETTVLGGAEIGETTVLNAVSPDSQRPYLVRQKNNEKILVDKPIYRIGKEKSYVDYFIGDNTAVSRSHASIISRGGEYFLVDTNSTNHSFINGAMVEANTEMRIVPGDIIHLANEAFEFKLI